GPNRGGDWGRRPGGRWLALELRLISRGIAVGASFAFTVSMGEFGAAVFLARPQTPTLPVAIFRLLGQLARSTMGRRWRSALF
ncbi:MAG: hypothetical protein HC915_12175, partial [Anaerolineae bacterium]|nr:hypothetical protein [Anaerolineae bacterium]